MKNILLNPRKTFLGQEVLKIVLTAFILALALNQATAENTKINKINVRQICDENGRNCKNINEWWAEVKSLSSWWESFEKDYGIFSWDKRRTRGKWQTPSVKTWPSRPKDGNYYIYLEVSWWWFPNKTYSIETIELNKQITNLSFHYHMYGWSIWNLYVDYHDGTNWQELWNKTWQQHSSYSSAWTREEINLNWKQVKKIRFRATTGWGWNWDIAIDDINLGFEWWQTEQTNQNIQEQICLGWRCYTNFWTGTSTSSTNVPSTNNSNTSNLNNISERWDNVYIPNSLLIWWNSTNTDPKSKLHVIWNLWVEWKIISQEVEVKPSIWADFVFDKNYKLRSIGNLKKFILRNKHLPDIPPEKEVKQKWISLWYINARLLQKIEELTLYFLVYSFYQIQNLPICLVSLLLLGILFFTLLINFI